MWFLIEDESEFILVCPFRPTQLWSTLLLEMVCEPPMVFFPRPNLLVSSQGESHPLCRTVSFRLSAWRLSGITSAAQEFRKRLSTSCWPASRSNTRYSYQSAWNVWSGWCFRGGRDPFSIDLNSVLSFLSDDFELGKSYSTLNVYRSMISSTLGLLNGTSASTP